MDGKDSIIEGVHTCYHCGNTGKLNYLTKTWWATIDGEDKPVYFQEGFLIDEECWYVFQCPVCKKPVLISKYCFYVSCPEEIEIKTEYPKIAVSADGVPKEIFTAFEAAVKTKGIDYQICLSALRRVLEMICKEQKAQGDTLEKKIEDLVGKQSFSTALKDACWVIRQLGNMAVHADELEIYNNEINQVIEFISIIIKYLYEMPYQVGKMKQGIEKKKEANKNMRAKEDI